jgi:hypothetical protein
MKNVWATTGCVSLRLDKIKEHESSTDHINSVAIEADQNNVSKCTKNMNNEAQNAICDAIKVLYFMVQDNLPLDLFSSLVDLIVELGGDNMKKLIFLIKLSVLVHTYCPFIHRSHA